MGYTTPPLVISPRFSGVVVALNQNVNTAVGISDRTPHLATERTARRQSGNPKQELTRYRKPEHQPAGLVSWIGNPGVTPQMNIITYSIFKSWRRLMVGEVLLALACGVPVLTS